MLWWTSCSWKSIFGTPSGFSGFVRAETCQSPHVLCLGFFCFFLMPQSLNWNIFSFGLKLCQWVQGPWHEWYWNSNESPTGGLFTWSYTLGPLNQVFFPSFLIIIFFRYKCICLVQMNPFYWHQMTQRKPVFEILLILLVNGACLLCWGCFVEALFLCAQAVDINPSSLFSVQALGAGSANQPHKSCISSVSEDTMQGRLKSQIGSPFFRDQRGSFFRFSFLYFRAPH